MKRYVLLSHDSKTMNTFYYDEMTGQICLLENKKNGKGLSVGVIAGLSILIYTFVRRIENPVSIDKNLLYWISLWIGIAAGILISLYGIRRAKRKIDAFARIYPCDTSEKQEIAKQNHKWFFSYIFLIIAMVAVCAVCRFLMIWVVPSVLVYAFFHSLMCMLTVLLIGAFVGNHPLKGWKIADKMRKGDLKHSYLDKDTGD